MSRDPINGASLSSRPYSMQVRDMDTWPSGEGKPCGQLGLLIVRKIKVIASVYICGRGFKQ